MPGGEEGPLAEADAGDGAEGGLVESGHGGEVAAPFDKLPEADGLQVEGEVPEVRLALDGQGLGGEGGAAVVHLEGGGGALGEGAEEEVVEGLDGFLFFLRGEGDGFRGFVFGGIGVFEEVLEAGFEAGVEAGGEEGVDLGVAALGFLEDGLAEGFAAGVLVEELEGLGGGQLEGLDAEEEGGGFLGGLGGGDAGKVGAAGFGEGVVLGEDGFRFFGGGGGFFRRSPGRRPGRGGGGGGGRRGGGGTGFSWDRGLDGFLGAVIQALPLGG